MTKSEIAISENANCAQNAKKRPNFATKGVYHLNSWQYNRNANMVFLASEYNSMQKGVVDDFCD